MGGDGRMDGTIEGDTMAGTGTDQSHPAVHQRQRHICSGERLQGKYTSMKLWQLGLQCRCAEVRVDRNGSKKGLVERLVDYDQPAAGSQCYVQDLYITLGAPCVNLTAS